MNSTAQKQIQNITQLDDLRNQNFELKQTIAQNEGEIIIEKAKCKSAQQQLQKAQIQNKRLASMISTLSQQKSQLLQTIHTSNYDAKNDSIQTKRYEEIANNYQKENQSLKQNMQKMQKQKMELRKQKMDCANKLIVAEAKLQGAKGQSQLIKVMTAQLEEANSELSEMRKQLDELRKGRKLFVEAKSSQNE